MTTRFVSPTGSASNPGTVESKPTTLNRASKDSGSGDTIVCLPGLYPNTTEQGISDSLPGVTITEKDALFAERPVMQGPWKLAGSGIVVRGLHFLESGNGNWIDAAGVNGLRFEQCRFHQDKWGSYADARYSGLAIGDCKKVVFDTCSFGSWLRGDLCQLAECDRVLFQDCDFATARGGHSVIAAKNTQHIIITAKTMKLARNPWDRFFTLVQQGDDSAPMQHVLVENYIFQELDWNGTTPHPFDGIADSQRGAGMGLRFCVQDGILRNCAILQTNLGKVSDPQGGVQMTMYDQSKRFRNNVLYNCIIEGSRENGFVCHIRSDAGSQLSWSEKNRFINCIFARSGKHEIAIKDDRVNWKTWRFESCCVHDPAQVNTIRLPTGEFSVQKVMDQFPAVFKALQSVAPKYLQDYTQADDSPYRGKGEALASVTTDGHGSVLPVSDARPFCDGWGLVPGDQIEVHGVKATVIDDSGNGSLKLDREIDFSIGDPVRLVVAGPALDVGLFNPRPLIITPPPPTAPTGLAGEAVRSIVLTWLPQEGISMWEVEYDGVIDRVVEGPPVDTISGVANGSHTCRVRAIDKYGQSGAWSAAIVVDA